MFIKKDIRPVTIALDRDFHDRVVYELGRQALVHISQSMEEIKKTGAARVLDLEAASSLAAGIAAAYHEVTDDEIDTSTDTAAAGREVLSRNSEHDRERVRAMQKKHAQLVRLEEGLAARLDAKKKELNEVHDLMSLELPQGLFDGTSMSWFFGRVGSLPEDYAADSYYIAVYGDYIVALAQPGHSERLGRLLAGCGFTDMKDRLLKARQDKAALHTLKDDTASLEDKLQWLAERRAHYRNEWAAELKELYTIYTVLSNTARELQKFIYTSDAVVIHGWIDLSRKGELEALLNEQCGGQYFFRIARRDEIPPGVEVPVLLKNNRLFRPFEMLVKNMGIPHNSELDPTPLAALSYVIMFGVMFGDVGQGMVLCLTGFLLRILARRKGRAPSFMSDGGAILIWGGLSATLFGFLYGSVFSNEHLLPAVLFHPMEEMMKLFFGAIMMGVLLISIGMIVNIINSIMAGHYEEALFGPHGMAGLALYGGAVVLAVGMIVFDRVPGQAQILLVLGVPLGIFILRNIFAGLLFHHRPMFPHGLFEYIVESAVEIIEMFSSFLGNTISFIRAGAFALSHAGLSIAVYTLAGIVSPDLLSPGSLAVLVVGNAFIIVLEGLVCGIQSMRLEYYEFFSKFFRGDGIEFTPFSLFKESHPQGGTR